MAIKSPQMFQLYFSYWIFLKSSFIFLWAPFMLAAWTRGTDGNLFPLCSSTVFKLTFEESTNATEVDRVGVHKPL